MYKLVIIDDERDARQRLCKLITSSDAHFEILAEYDNGADAYEGLAGNMPDLLISDIKIPYIDGITLAKQAKVLFPLLKIIFVTGYDEYDYAKEAANIGVVGFANKPITQEEMNALLEKAENELDDYYENSSNFAELREFYDKNLSLIKNNDLERLSNMSEISDNFRKKLAQNGINLDYSDMVMCVVDFDNLQIDEKNVYELTFSFLDSALKETCGSTDFELFNRSDKFGVLIKSNREIKSEFIEKTFVPLIEKVKKTLGVCISIGVGLPSRGNSDFKLMYGQAMEALEARGIIGGGEDLFLLQHGIAEAREHRYRRVCYKKYRLYRQVQIGKRMPQMSRRRKKFPAGAGKQQFLFLRGIQYSRRHHSFLQRYGLIGQDVPRLQFYLP